MSNWLSQFADRQLVMDCGRLLLMSVSAAYVGANMRRLAVRRGWDLHFLHLSDLMRLARGCCPGRRRWLWLTICSGSGVAIVVVLAMAL